ncbi:hexokinase type 2-like [Episyrphus balteatus]|uniref:hexokinase type 2-like n=1 Tax=Episyrphus balteatus TaxID=286459 RepID=UPI0024864E12|nr:hexokinase type 2-like [Episyrphus balteatus]
MSNNNIKRKCRALMEEFILDNTQLLEINRRFLNELNRGLCKKTHDQADVKCFVTYVQDLPTGEEIGRYMALDLGGTNFRVLLVTLKAHHEADIESKTYAISQEIMTGPGVDLFDHIAECLAVFMKEQDLIDEHLHLGFTFSFPCKQVGLTKGYLIRWTKGFNCPGVENEDVVQLLREAIKRRGDINISVVAILNDTTGTLMSCAHRNKNCHIGTIIGTGCNACYLERVENVELFDSPPGKPYVIVNAEMGAFGESGALDFVRTEYDRIIDRNSMNPGKQIYEKMISGMYMGEIVRLVLLKAIEQKILLPKGGKQIKNLAKPESFETRFVSEIEADNEGEYTNCKKILTDFGFSKPTNEDCAEVRYICECVSQRAAHLVACSQATMINKIDEGHTTVGVDGTVYRLHPRFNEYMEEKMKELVNPNIGFNLMLSEDGSGRGAALVAATVTD